MRIVSLVPNATEILFALGAGDLLVGVSHECDFPAEARRLPQLTGSALDAGLDAAQIDRAVGAQLAGGESLYTLDEDRIAALRPNLIVTQSLCPVCAVSTAQVDGATAPMETCPQVISLDPRTLEDVFSDIGRLGRALDLESRARSVIVGLRERLAEVRRSVRGRERPTVAALEWLDPPFVAGHWVPEMIEWAGGRDAFGEPGDPSRRISWSELAAADPDVVVGMPCGFDREGAAAQLAAAASDTGWTSLRAVRDGRVFPVDANGCFSRPGPRLVDGIEALAACLRES